jgi:hypothetical protein
MSKIEFVTGHDTHEYAMQVAQGYAPTEVSWTRATNLKYLGHGCDVKTQLVIVQDVEIGEAIGLLVGIKKKAGLALAFPGEQKRLIITPRILLLFRETVTHDAVDTLHCLRTN